MSATSSLHLGPEVGAQSILFGQLRQVQIDDRTERLRHIVEDVVAGVFDIQPHLLRKATRGRAQVALARQVAMYIAHVSYGLSLNEVGAAFERDRTTVAHACSVVEVKREEPQFDEAITLVERIIRAMCGATGAIEKGASAKANANSRDR
jgi:chromosomal replication initiation ATPase DnaA